MKKLSILGIILTIFASSVDIWQAFSIFEYYLNSFIFEMQKTFPQYSTVIPPVICISISIFLLWAYFKK